MFNIINLIYNTKISVRPSPCLWRQKRRAPDGGISKVPCCKSMTAAGFKVAFKGLRLCEGFECNVGLDFPWKELGSMGNLTGIVFCEAGAKVGCAADITLVGMG